MTIEIRELVIEARVLADGDERDGCSASQGSSSMQLDAVSQQRLIAQVVQRVLRVLEDRGERLQ
ncbi:DUF5908 family protein [Pseudomonas khavaziana]|uniref:DUF5908 family protein n=1 Tax=Pseudomonas khavaziana TaxID=2842351 RepID=UPI001C3E65A2|nr:DUF5908 family protein [Pseudomonas khavaziana]MBV4482648.1 hypothetical protein [Pseudomonas khavaziana]